MLRVVAGLCWELFREGLSRCVLAPTFVLGGTRGWGFDGPIRCGGKGSLWFQKFHPFFPLVALGEKDGSFHLFSYWVELFRGASFFLLCLPYFAWQFFFCALPRL